VALKPRCHLQTQGDLTVPSAPRHRSVRALAGLFMLVTFGAALASASFTTTAQALTLRDDADEIMNKTYVDFLKVKDRKPEPPAPFDWDDNGCSGIPKLREVYRKVFDQPCQQHDFGYRNYGNGLQLGRRGSTRLWIDRRFLTEMRRLCDTRWAGTSARRRAGRVACRGSARFMYDRVREFGGFAFYGDDPKITLKGQSDPRLWRISTSGLGPIKLGRTPVEVRAVGVTLNVRREEFCDVWTVPGLDGVTMLAPHSRKKALREIQLHDRSGHGAFSVENGDSLEDLRARAGSRLEFVTEDESLGAAFYRIYSPTRSTALQFRVDTQQVSFQQAGYPGEFYLPDGQEMCG